MRHILFIFLFNILHLPLDAQISDDFSDGNFSSDPIWIGDTLNFDVVNQVLVLKAPMVSDTSVLYTASEICINATWKMSVQLGFDPSSSNYLHVYLMSDSADIKGEVTGYFLKIGGTQDEISLYRQDGTDVFKLIDGKDKSLDKPVSIINLMVTRDSLYTWTLQRDTSGGNNYFTEGTASDSIYKSSAFFGFYCKYTSTRSDKFSFDDISVSGEIFTDLVKPVINRAYISSSREWTLHFSENILRNGIKNSFFTLNDDDFLITDITYDSLSNVMVIKSDMDFQHGKKMELSVDSIADISGNLLKSVTFYDVFNHPDSFLFKDIVFTELMSDPEPALNLPETEYLELYNRSGLYLKTTGMKITDLKDTAIFTEQEIFGPESYRLLLDFSDSLLWSSFEVKKTYLDMPSLNNDGDCLYVLGPNNVILDSVCYTSSQLDNVANGGGVSLELVNPEFICSHSVNWMTSAAIEGGSPGTENSVLQTEINYNSVAFQKLITLDDSSFELKFNGHIKSQKDLLGLLFIRPTVVMDEVQMIEQQILWIKAAESLKKNTEYEIALSGLTDCYDRPVKQIDIQIVVPGVVIEKKLIINEVLFNPKSGCFDFVEIYNNSDQYIDLSALSLANYENDTISNVSPIYPVYRILPPDDYVAITKDSSGLVKCYPNTYGTVLQTAEMPAMNDDAGSIYLLTNKDLIDVFKYDELMHFPLLTDNEGVSLERISSRTSTSNATNWISASSASDYATPGKINSQNVQVNTHHFSLEPDIFSPDNDGYADVLSINYQLPEAGFAGNVKIFNSAGRQVKQLISNQYLDSQGVFFWNGLDDNGTSLDWGYYVILFNAYGMNGETLNEMASVVLAGNK